VNSLDHKGESDQLSRLYREIVLKHAQSPIGFGKTIQATHRHEEFNPLCGDRVLLMLEIEGPAVVDAAFEGESCAICRASASLLCERAPGSSVRELKDMYRWLELALKEGGCPNDGPNDGQSLTPLLGVRRFPSRVNCALLPWEVLSKAV
jgi:nitrogen fixation NifU-like protein